HALVCLAVLVLYGLSDEYHQSFTAGRTPLFTDVLFDSTGGLIGLLIRRYAPYWGAARVR
ncbi:MAG: VanZ family protein, partial [Chloroflexi bacterium]|nr:VanZ family protein [Chloroflexota bacterium]